MSQGDHSNTQGRRAGDVNQSPCLSRRLFLRDRPLARRLLGGGRAYETEPSRGRKNLAVIMKRFEKVQEIRRYLGVARGQLDLIENSFRLLADQIVTMQSPQQLSGQLDELLDGVQAIKDSTADTERLLSSLGLASNA